MREETNRQESTGVEFARAERSARGQRLRGGSESTLGRPGVRGRVREGPRTNGKSKCSETRPMGAGRRQIESVALCVWQCHLRNVSTLSNRTPVCCGEDQSFAYGGEKVYNNGDISMGLYGGSEEKSLCRNERGQQSDRAAVV